MGYITYDYYKSIYGEDSMPETDFNRIEWKAEKQIDRYTLNKLQFAFPTKESAIKDVQMCMSEIINLIYQVEQYQKSAMEGMGYIKEADGTLKGKVITSVSSGSESIGLSAGGNSTNTDIAECAKDSKKLDSAISGIVSTILTYTEDSNGIYLTNRALPYPVRHAPISRPPENKPVEKPEEPTEPPETPPDESEGGENIQAQSNTENKSGTVGLGYVDSVIVYNRYVRGLLQTEEYYGTRFDNVRIEFTEEENQTKAGQENTSVCILKIHNDNTLPKPFKDPVSWKKLTTEEMQENFTLQKGEDFFVIVKRKGLNLDVEAPVGLQSSDDPIYGGNFFEYMKGKYGYVYSINSFEQKELIPYYQVGGL